MSDKLPGTSVQRRRGAAEVLLAQTMRAWNNTGLYAGPEWAAARGVLRDAARAVDAARDDMRAGEGSAYSFARANDIYRTALAAFQSGGKTGDEIEDLVNGLDAE